MKKLSEDVLEEAEEFYDESGSYAGDGVNYDFEQFMSIFYNAYHIWNPRKKKCGWFTELTDEERKEFIK